VHHDCCSLSSFNRQPYAYPSFPVVFSPDHPFVVHSCSRRVHRLVPVATGKRRETLYAEGVRGLRIAASIVLASLLEL